MRHQCAQAPRDWANSMPLFEDMFSTRTQVQLICVLSALLACKAMGAYFGFRWAAALAAYGA